MLSLRPETHAPQVIQACVVAYDEDVSLLDIHLTNGAVYRVTHPGHAAQIYEKLTPGGTLTADQVGWLDAHYRVPPQIDSRARLRLLLRNLRQELRTRSTR